MNVNKLTIICLDKFSIILTLIIFVKNVLGPLEQLYNYSVRNPVVWISQKSYGVIKGINFRVKIAD